MSVDLDDLFGDESPNVVIDEDFKPSAPPGTPVEPVEATSTPKTAARKTAAKKQKAVEPDPARDEIQRIEPDTTGPVVLENGLSVEIVPLKLRETMKLLKIVTRGAGSILESTIGELNMDDPAAFAQTFGALVLFSIPEAEDEAVEFIQSMVLPYGFVEMTQADKIDGLNALAVELSNPELGDVISIIERVIRRESEDIRSLGKRISQAFQLSRKVENLPANN